MDIVLTADGYKFALTSPKPQEPGSDSSVEDKANYDKWVKANDMAKCYILASVSNVIQHQHQYYTVASDIMFSIKEMFGTQGRLERQKAM